MAKNPQAGIFTDASTHHYYLEYQVANTTDLALLRRALANVRDLPGQPDTGVQATVLGFSPDLWRRLSTDAPPQPFDDFTPLEGSSGQRAMATQADLWIWLQGNRHDANFARALQVNDLLAAQLQLRLDLHGFVYGASRDLTGFEDGTANPKGSDRYAAAVVPEGQPGTGGSLVVTQRWVHDLGRFLALPQVDQEAVIGRTKDDSIELEGDAMPVDSHVIRTDVKQDGIALKIYRRSVPYGNMTEHGLYFVAFACSQHRFRIIYERMYGATADGLHDRLVGYSQAITGSYWFAPSVEDLACALAPR